MQQSSIRTLAAVGLSVVLVVGAAIAVRFAFQGYGAFAASRETNKLHKVHPSPEHSPTDVVRFQMAALSQVDQPHPGAGMELVYAFLAPDQRDTIGDLNQLAALFTKPPYLDLVSYHSAKLGDARIAGNHAQQPVLVLTPDKRLAAYVFLLTRQEDGDYAGSWMTVALLPMQLQVGTGQPPPQMEPALVDTASPAD